MSSRESAPPAVSASVNWADRTCAPIAGAAPTFARCGAVACASRHPRSYTCAASLVSSSVAITWASAASTQASLSDRRRPQGERAGDLRGGGDRLLGEVAPGARDDEPALGGEPAVA